MVVLKTQLKKKNLSLNMNQLKTGLEHWGLCSRQGTIHYHCILAVLGIALPMLFFTDHFEV